MSEVLPERSLDQEFYDLVYGDPDLLAADFDELVAASWGRPPASDGRFTQGHRPRRPRHVRGGPHPSIGEAQTHPRPACRWQRGPPPKTVA
ncbi:MAG TPA: hypothetical protein VFT31_06650 [Kribbella sp.]|nr:hypothetical protein [Kribbella sp.]